MPLSMTSTMAWLPSRRALTMMRPRPSTSGGTAPIEARRHAFGRELDVDVDVGMADAEQEHRLAHRLGDVLVFHDGLRHPGKARELVDHALDVVDLADDGVGALHEDGR